MRGVVVIAALLFACKSDGDPELIGTLPGDRAEGIAVDGEYVYAAGWTEGNVVRMDIESGETTELYSSANRVNSVLLDGNELLWSNDAGEVWRAPKDGSGEPELIAMGLGWAFGFRVDGDTGYAVDFAYPAEGAGKVFSFDARSLSSATPLSDIPTGQPIDVLDAGPDLLVSAQLTPIIYRVAKAGGSAKKFVDLGEDRDAQHLAGTADHFYTASHHDRMALLEVRDGEVSVVYDGPEVVSPTGVALEGKHLYWSNYYSREVWRIEL